MNIKKAIQYFLIFVVIGMLFAFLQHIDFRDVFFVLLLFAIGIIQLLMNSNLYLYRVVLFCTQRISFLRHINTDKIRKTNQLMVQYYKANKYKFYLAFVLSVFHWLSGAMEFYIILSLLNFPISILDATILEMGVMLIKTIGGFVPGQLGIEEQGNRLMLSVIGLSSASLWVIVSLLRRSRQLFWLATGVLYWLLWYPRTKKMRVSSIKT